MIQRHFLAILTGGALLAGLLSGCGGTEENSMSAGAAQEPVVQSIVEAASEEFSGEETAASGAEASVQPSHDCDITLNGDSITINGNGAAVAGSAVTITQAGCYHISGTLRDGQIIVETDNKSLVTLSLEGADIICSNGAPIYVKKADAVYIETDAGSENTLTDGAKYDLAEGEDEPDAAIFSKDDLYFTGEGTLTVTGGYDMAVHGKDSVYVEGGSLILTAVGDGLKGKDQVGIFGGDLTIDAGSDGIQTSNDTELGDILISGGTVTVTAAEDGVKVEATDRCKTGVTNLHAHWEVYVDPFVDAICAARNLTFFSEGESPWFVDGDGAARSGAIGDDGATTLTTTVQGKGTLSFRWRTSSEGEYDWLRLRIDGNEVASISGERAWADFSHAIATEGSHTVEWRYDKDGSVSDGEDCGWIDDVVWTPEGGA